MGELFSAREVEFLVDLGLAFLCGLIIGLEREAKKKPAGVSTQTLVITSAMLFSFLSRSVGAVDPSRIAAQVVTGIGFLGGGLIIYSKGSDKVENVTTAASIWYSAAIGMALGFNMHLIAVIGAFYAVVVSAIPPLPKKRR